MIADGRSWAWVIAWQMLKQAEKLRTDPRTKKSIESPVDLYWGWLAEAKTFAQLATADMAVGIGAGAWLEAQKEAEDESLQRTEEFMERRAADKPAEEDEEPIHRTLYAECGHGCQATAVAGEPHPLAFTCGHGYSYTWAGPPT